jgi:glycosyltransferase involved in cell wall biosynthesis
MNILVSVENFYPPRGGGELSLKTLFSRLGQTHRVKILCTGDSDKDFKWHNIEISIRKVKSKSAPEPLVALGTYSEKILRQLVKELSTNQVIRCISRDSYWEEVVEQEVQKFNPEILFTQLNFTPASVKVAVEHNIPSVVFLRSYEHLCPMGFEKKDPNCNKQCSQCFLFKIKLLNPALTKINTIFVKMLLRRHENALKSANCVIANSSYIANLTLEWLNVKSVVLYPFINLNDYKIPMGSKPMECDRKLDRNKYITFIKPTKTKGVEIILKLTQKLPDRKFLILGKGEPEFIMKLKRASNVRYIRWCPDMREIYSRTRLLLVPSLWPEPFGRVVVEAGSNGIPSIVSNLGGLPEAIGNGGIIIDEPRNAKRWVEAISSLDDPERYAMLVQNARRNSERFGFEIGLKRFKYIIEKRLGLQL